MTQRTKRLDSVDLLRGLVMVIMVLDHVRDYFHNGAQLFSPEDLSRTNTILFFTRWVTHFCAPVFVFLAGAGISFSGVSVKASRFLLARGLWLILLELTAVNFAFAFNLRLEFLGLQVIWVIGLSMVIMAGLIWVPHRVLALLSVSMILLHNLLDSVRLPGLHDLAPVQIGGTLVLFAYPLIPWVGVMAAGFCFGDLLRSPQRKLWCFRIGAAATLGFLLLRFINVYGDPSPWDGLSVLSFLRASKYPPSLQYLLMTLGPALLLLSWLDGRQVKDDHPLRVFGRVPMFFYLLHWYLLHGLAVIAGGLRYGDWTFLLQIPPALAGRNPPGFPPDYGWDLPVVYLVWAVLVASLYLPCRWFMRYKADSSAGWTRFV